MARRKLPPYGRELLELRNAGHVPLKVFVLCGPDCWKRRPKREPSIAVPDDGVYDFSILAGLEVWVVDRGGEFIRVGAQIARHTAPVKLAWVAGNDDVPHAPGDTVVEDIALVDPFYRAIDEDDGRLKEFRAAYWTREEREAYEQGRLDLLIERTELFIEDLDAGLYDRKAQA